MSVRMDPTMHVDSCEWPLHFTYRWGAYDADGYLIEQALSIVCLRNPHTNLAEMLAEMARSYRPGLVFAAWTGGATYPVARLDASVRPDAVYRPVNSRR